MRRSMTSILQKLNKVNTELQILQQRCNLALGQPLDRNDNLQRGKQINTQKQLKEQKNIGQPVISNASEESKKKNQNKLNQLNQQPYEIQKQTQKEGNASEKLQKEERPCYSEISEDSQQIEQYKQQFPQNKKIQNIYQNGKSQTMINMIQRGDYFNMLKQISRVRFPSKSQSDSDNYQSIPHPMAEISACKKFKNKEDPYVIRYFKIFKTPKFYNIQMQRCQGGTLYEQLINDKIANQRAQFCVIYLMSMLYSLTATHLRGISMHRDIKPQNFLVTNDLVTKRLKLADFGACTKSLQSKTFAGTELYQAIEVFATQNKWLNYKHKNKLGYLPNCDIYSIGVICFHMCNGPLRGKNKLSFPFQQNILDELEKPQKKKQRIAIFKQYFRDIVKFKQSLLSFVKWNYTGANKIRMDKFIELTRKMLEIDPEKRPNTLRMYKLINQCKEDLFAGLEDLYVCKDFNQKYQDQKNSEKLRKRIIAESNQIYQY